MIPNTVETAVSIFEESNALERIDALDQELLDHFNGKFLIEPALNRTLVSFQANKTRPVYRWYKYKEAFSANLVDYLFLRYGILQGKMLDPFAGSGTSLFAASAAGLDADGIELLPIGQQIIKTRRILELDFFAQDFAALHRWFLTKPWREIATEYVLPELRITRDAYPDGAKKSIQQYISQSRKENERLQLVLQFALLCVLELISYTRKDGQYLRWDYRSNRRQGKKPFDKGGILEFDRAICEKLNEIIMDCSPSCRGQSDLFPTHSKQGAIKLYEGSCLNFLPTLPDNSYDVIITSPPYCNRYDYTRTYALELALLGVDEKGISRLRQEMLSCTVENRAKDLIAMNTGWQQGNRSVPLPVMANFP